jgi:hypothetical protein
MLWAGTQIDTHSGLVYSIDPLSRTNCDIVGGGPGFGSLESNVNAGTFFSFNRLRKSYTYYSAEVDRKSDIV